MEIISATEAKQNFAALLDRAQKAPILIRRQKRDVAVIIPKQHYEAMRSQLLGEEWIKWETIAKEAEKRGLTDEKLAEILAQED